MLLDIIFFVRAIIAMHLQSDDVLLTLSLVVVGSFLTAEGDGAYKPGRRPTGTAPNHIAGNRIAARSLAPIRA